MFLVCSNDALDEGMPDDVAFAEFHNGNAFDMPQRSMRFHEPGLTMSRL